MANNTRSVNVTDQGDRTGGNAEDGGMSSLMNQMTPPSDSDDFDLDDDFSLGPQHRDMVNYAPRPGRSQTRPSAQAMGGDQTLFGHTDTLREAATFTLRRGRSQQAETQTVTMAGMSQPDAGRDIISDMRRLNDDMAEHTMWCRTVSNCLYSTIDDPE